MSGQERAGRVEPPRGASRNERRPRIYPRPNPLLGGEETFFLPLPPGEGRGEGRCMRRPDSLREGAMADHDEGEAPWVADRTVGDVLRVAAREHPGRDAVVFPALGLRWSNRKSVV